MNFSFNQSDYYKINQNNNIRNIYAYQQNIINPYIYRNPSNFNNGFWINNSYNIISPNNTNSNNYHYLKYINQKFPEIENNDVLGNANEYNNNILNSNKYNLDKNNITKNNNNIIDRNSSNNIPKLNNTLKEYNILMVNEKKLEKPSDLFITSEKKINKLPCGIINYGNNCYLNSGLQILATCDNFVKELRKFNNIKYGLIFLINDAFYKILKEQIYDPKNILIFFCNLNNEHLSSQYCSQNFIRTILRNINNELIKYGDKHLITEYNQYKPKNQIEQQNYLKFIKSNNYFPECMALKLFSGISKSHSYGKCQLCSKYIEEYSFSYFIDQNIYLDNIPNNIDFSRVLFENLGNINNLTMNCPKCNKEINIEEKTKFIKLPEILIFTLERYKEGINNIRIIPDNIIDMKGYLDNSVDISNSRYELFGINIRFGKTNDFGHEICQIKRNGEWCEIDDLKVNWKISDYNDNSYGLFYRRL
jgi:ubiquitin C-terminal hydrolase